MNKPFHRWLYNTETTCLDMCPADFTILEEQRKSSGYLSKYMSALYNQQYANLSLIPIHILLEISGMMYIIGKSSIMLTWTYIIVVDI